MHYDTSLYSAGCKEKIAVDEAVFWSTIGPHLCTCGATLMGNPKCRRTRKEYQSRRKVGFLYGSPLIPSLPTHSKFPTPLLVTNSIWNWFLCGQMLWAPLLRPLWRNQDLDMNLKVKLQKPTKKTRRKNKIEQEKW